MRSNFNLPLKPVVALFALLSLGLFVPGAFAQGQRPAAKTNAPSAGGNRFLLIVDTSSSMKSGAADMLHAVDDIIRTSASGQLHAGDTLGVWTFNRELYAGLLPLQTWALADTNEIALRTLEFLKQQRYRGESHLDKALEGMYAVIKGSDIITVFLISNGQNPIQGTPFDQQINALYVESVKEMKKDRKPIVTVLQAKRGKIIRYTVNALPWPVVIPEVPIPIKTAEIAATPQNTPPVTPAPAPQSAPRVVAQNPPPAITTPTPAPAPVVAVPPPAVTPKSAPPVATPPPVAAPHPFPPFRERPPSKTLPPPVIRTNPNPPVAVSALPPADNSEPAPTPPAAKPAVHAEAPPAPAAIPAKPNPAPVAAQATVSPYTGSKYLLIAAIASGAAGLALIALLIIRLRTPPGPSLITRTMGNPPRK
jgi:hypothetical protein